MTASKKWLRRPKVICNPSKNLLTLFLSLKLLADSQSRQGECLVMPCPLCPPSEARSACKSSRSRSNSSNSGHPFAESGLRTDLWRATSMPRGLQTVFATSLAGWAPPGLVASLPASWPQKPQVHGAHAGRVDPPNTLKSLKILLVRTASTHSVSSRPSFSAAEHGYQNSM